MKFCSCIKMNGTSEDSKEKPCHTRKKKKTRPWKKPVSPEAPCENCGKVFCVKCLSKYRFPLENHPPSVCRNCFSEHLHRLIFSNISYEDRRCTVAAYMKSNLFQQNESVSSLSSPSEEEHMHDDLSSSMPQAEIKHENSDQVVENEEMDMKKEKQEEEENDTELPGFFATYNLKPKIPVSAKVLDKVAMGLLRMSGMYEGGVLNRTYVQRASKRKIKHIETVGRIEKLTIPVPYRYETNDYNFEEYKLDPETILEPPKEDEPESYDLELKIYHYYSSEKEITSPQPVLIWFHGGGFVMGDVDDSVLNRSMSRFCNMIQGVVVSVNYRLAPEFKWPTQPEDGYSALQWVYNEGEDYLKIDKNMISIGGDSAGGNLAAVVSIMSKEREGPKILHQVCIYPGVDGESTDSDSYMKYGNGPFLRLSLLRWFKKQYLYAPDANCGVHPYLSPLQYRHILGLPPLTMITAGYCPLTDHAKEYARKLSREGVPTTYTEYSVSFHGFFHSFTKESMEAITHVGVTVKYHIDIAKDILYGRHENVEEHAEHRHLHEEQPENEEDEEDVDAEYSGDINCL